MPQGKQRTLAEKASFDWMLQNVNFLFLGMHVFILLDMSYLSRFWCAHFFSPHNVAQTDAYINLRVLSRTQFEAWLSLQMPTPLGLVPATLEFQRHTIVPIHNADDAIRAKLFDMWADKSPEDATAVLSRPDIQVTNQSDKLGQIPKLLALNENVKAVMKQRTVC